MGCAHSHRADDGLHYIKPVAGSLPQKGESEIYRCAYTVDKLRDGLSEHPQIQNLQQFHLYHLNAYAQEPFLGHRTVNPDGSLSEYHWMNRGEAETLARKVGSALSNLKMVEPVPGDEKFQKEFRFFGIYAKNRPEWVIADIASALYGYTVIPLYDTLGADAMAHVFKQTQCSTVLSSGDNVGKLLKGVADKSYISLKNIVSFDELKPEIIQEAGKLGVNIFDWKDFVLNGEQKPVEYAKNIPSEHVFTFNYTSGTTSLPKAVVLTHRNVLGAIGGYNDLRFEEVTTNCGPGDFYLSYLPLAHVLERMFIHQMCFKGCAIGFYNGDPFKLDQDLLALRPTIFTAVPRILNRFYDKIKKKLDELHGIKKDLAEKAIQTKMENLRAGEGYTHFIYDRLVFSSMKAAIGGRVKVILSGGAPLSHEIGEFLKICFCCPIVEGYGLTETAACGTMQIPLDWESSKVGGVVPCVEIKVVEIPEMNYLLSDKTDGEVCPRGEICIRGTTVFKGYYKDEKETQAVLDVDGWLHTGDVGRINKDGSLSIIDRKKNIFKLAQGEYIAPDKIENIYLQSHYIAESFVYGDSLKNYLIGVFVPQKDKIMAIGKEQKIEGSFEELCKNDKVKAVVAQDLAKVAKEGKLSSFETVKQIHLEPTSFITLGLCTPSLKLKRNPARDYYKKEGVIDFLYNLPLEKKE